MGGYFLYGDQEHQIVLADVVDFPQSAGSEMIANGNMETGDPPTGWLALSAAALSAQTDERTGGVGSKSLQILRTTTASPSSYRTFTATNGGFAELLLYGRNVDGTSVSAAMYDTVGAISVPKGAPFYSGTDWARMGLIRRTVASTSVRLTATTATEATGGRFDDVSVKYIALNPQQSIEANADIWLRMALPAEPFIGQQLIVPFRIKNTLTAEHNCWHAQIWRNSTNAAWDFRLSKFTAGVESVVWETLDIGVPDHIRILCYGSTIQILTREGSGDWIPRTPQLSDSHMSLETGLNVISATGVTPQHLLALRAVPFGYGLTDNNRFVAIGDSKSAYQQWQWVFKRTIEADTGELWTFAGQWATGGYVISQAAAAIDAQIAAYTDDDPVAAIINLGANDVASAPGATAKSNLLYIVDALHAAYPDCAIYIAKVYVTNSVSNCDILAGLIDEIVSERSGIAFVGIDERVLLENDDGGATYMSDGKHPNTAGYVATAVAWAQLLAA